MPRAMAGLTLHCSPAVAPLPVSFGGSSGSFLDGIDNAGANPVTLFGKQAHFYYASGTNQFFAPMLCYVKLSAGLNLLYTQTFGISGAALPAWIYTQVYWGGSNLRPPQNRTALLLDSTVVNAVNETGYIDVSDFDSLSIILNIGPAFPGSAIFAFSTNDAGVFIGQVATASFAAGGVGTSVQQSFGPGSVAGQNITVANNVGLVLPRNININVPALGAGVSTNLCVYGRRRLQE
jgi:hypothetical protein